MILHIVREFLNKEKEDDTGGDTSNPAYETSPTFELEKGSHARAPVVSLGLASTTHGSQLNRSLPSVHRMMIGLGLRCCTNA